jgi:hypothetical protein
VIVILIVVGIMILIALIGMDAAHDRYRRQWLKAVELLTISDEQRDQLAQHRAAYAQTVSEQSATIRAQRDADLALRAEVEDLKHGFSELYELGVELIAERESAAAAHKLAAAAHKLAAAAPKPPRTTRSTVELIEQENRGRMAHESILRLIEEGGKGAAHTP